MLFKAFCMMLVKKIFTKLKQISCFISRCKKRDDNSKSYNSSTLKYTKFHFLPSKVKSQDISNSPKDGYVCMKKVICNKNSEYHKVGVVENKL